jgi:hypothetical protein
VQDPVQRLKSILRKDLHGESIPTAKIADYMNNHILRYDSLNVLTGTEKEDSNKKEFA